jgi:type VI secretion system secreted protein VgrG
VAVAADPHYRRKIFRPRPPRRLHQSVFGAFGLSDFDESGLSATYPTATTAPVPRAAFDFVSRLMEEEGIFYSFAYTPPSTP